MTDEEREEFKTTVAAQGSQIVQALMKSELGPTDSAFCLGAAAALIAGLMAKFKKVPLEQTRSIVLEAFMDGFENTAAEVIIIDKPASGTH